MMAILDRLSDGRLLINVVTGGDLIENKGDGLFVDHRQRYEITREFLSVYVPLLLGEIVDYWGEHIRAEDSRLLFRSKQAPWFLLYFGGLSDAGIDVVVEMVDKYLIWGELPV